jgi:hypothetical protein
MHNITLVAIIILLVVMIKQLILQCFNLTNNTKDFVYTRVAAFGNNVYQIA